MTRQLIFVLYTYFHYQGQAPQQNEHKLVTLSIQKVKTTHGSIQILEPSVPRQKANAGRNI